MRASKTFFTEYYGAENFTWLESVMSRTIGSTMVYRGETLECSKWDSTVEKRKEEGIRSRSLRLCRKLTLLDIFYLFPDALLFLLSFAGRKKAKSESWELMDESKHSETYTAACFYNPEMMKELGGEYCHQAILPSGNAKMDRGRRKGHLGMGKTHE